MGWLEDIAKRLPVEKAYFDALQPAFREIGDVARNTIKASRFILAPIDYLAAQQDRYQSFLKKVNERVPEERMIPAHPQISGPVIEGLRYIEKDSILAELFINLLARAIDKERVNEAHPAFANIISQLSPDEAFIIFNLNKKDFKLKQHSKFFPETHTFGPRKTIANEFPVAELVYPDNFFLYMDHLHSLNMAGVWQHGNQESIMDGNIQTGVHINNITQLTIFGKLFAKACMPNKL
ncbi:MAG: Abi-alpha family protein [Pseudomonadota bacterium]